MPPIPNHAVASLGVGPGFGGVPRRHVVKLLLHLWRRDVKNTPGILEHSLHCVVPWGELATALQPPHVCVSRCPASGRPRLGPPIVGRGRCRGARHELSPLGHGRMKGQTAQVKGVGRGPGRSQPKTIPPAFLRPLQGRAVVRAGDQARPVDAEPPEEADTHPKSDGQTKTGCTPRASDDTLAASALISTFS